MLCLALPCTAMPSTLYVTICAVAPPDTLDKIDQDIEQGSPLSLVAHLPAIHAAIQATEEDALLQLVAQFKGEEDLEPADRISTTSLIRAVKKLTTADVQTLSSLVVHTVAGGLSGPELRAPETLGAVHHVIAALPKNIQDEVRLLGRALPLLSPSLASSHLPLPSLSRAAAGGAHASGGVPSDVEHRGRHGDGRLCGRGHQNRRHAGAAAARHEHGRELRRREGGRAAR